MTRSLVNEVFIFILIVILFFNSTACMKRVPVPLDAGEIQSHDTIIVHLKSGIDYKLKNPKSEEGYLIGMYSNHQIKISLKEIKSIETERPNKKKFIISYVIIMGSLAVFAILFYPFGAFENLE